MTKLPAITALAILVLFSAAAFAQVVPGGPGGPKPLTPTAPAPTAPKAASKAAPAQKAAKAKANTKSASTPSSPKTGLPKGEGYAEIGKTIFAEKCAICHGWKGEKGETGPGLGMGQCWATTLALFGYVKRAMPFQKPGTLTNDDVYSLLAYLFASTGIIDENLVMDARALPEIEMPAAKAALLPSYCEGGLRIR